MLKETMKTRACCHRPKQVCCQISTTIRSTKTETVIYKLSTVQFITLAYYLQIIGVFVIRSCSCVSNTTHKCLNSIPGGRFYEAAYLQSAVQSETDLVLKYVRIERNSNETSQQTAIRAIDDIRLLGSVDAVVVFADDQLIQALLKVVCFLNCFALSLFKNV